MRCPPTAQTARSSWARPPAARGGPHTMLARMRQSVCSSSATKRDWRPKRNGPSLDRLRLSDEAKQDRYSAGVSPSPHPAAEGLSSRLDLSLRAMPSLVQGGSRDAPVDRCDDLEGSERKQTQGHKPQQRPAIALVLKSPERPAQALRLARVRMQRRQDQKGSDHQEH